MGALFAPENPDFPEYAQVASFTLGIHPLRFLLDANPHQVHLSDEFNRVTGSAWEVQPSEV